MGFGSFFKKIGKGISNAFNKVKEVATDVKDGFKYGWNATKDFIVQNGRKIPVVGDLASTIAGKLPSFDNSNNPVADYFNNQ